MNTTKLCLTGLLFSFFSSYSQVQEITPDSLNYAVIELKEVVIQSLRKKQYIDKSVYTFNQDALDKATYAKDLLSTLPELTLDPISNKVISIKGGTTLFLINGIEVTDNQLRTIIPSTVVKVEFYDIPPIRWTNRANQVINIITRNPENGYVYGADVLTALSTGFVNGSAYSNVTKGRTNFGVDYSINLRDYNNRTHTNSTAYKLEDVSYRAEEKRKDHFGYTNQNMVFRYTNTDTDQYTFQAKLNLTLMESFNYAGGNSLFFKQQKIEEHTIYHVSA